MLNKTLMRITENILEDIKNSISYRDACELAALPDDNTIDLIMCAGKIRDKYRRSNVFTCSIINAKSGFCSQDCAFCAQSVHHKTGIDTYPLLSEDELLNNAVRMHEAGATR